MKKINLVRILNIVAILLLLAMVICQFLPNWTMKEETLSVSEYVWRPHEHKTFTKQLQKTLDTELDAGSIVGLHIILAAGSIVGIWFSIAKNKSLLPAVIYGLVGVYGVLQMPGNVIFRAGNHYMIFFILCIALIVVALATIVTGILQKKKETV